MIPSSVTHIKLSLLTSLILFEYAQAGIFAYLGIVGGAAALKYTYEQAKCQFAECCHPPQARYKHINFKTFKEELEANFEKHLFGQHLVVELVPKLIDQHLNNNDTKKPLVISFHGWTGSGKSLTSRLIAESMFHKGYDSDFVLHFFPGDFSNMEVPEIVEGIKRMIERQADICPHSLIIIEEADKFDPKVFELLSNFVSNNKQSKYHPLVFLLLSNTGGSKIVEFVYKHLQRGKLRKEIKLHELERLIDSQAFDEEGGMKKSEMISRFLIDHYIPFLPLQRSHVRKCIVAELNKRNVIAAPHIIEEVLNYLEFYPDDEQMFSLSGCKLVVPKVNVVVD